MAGLRTPVQGRSYLAVGTPRQRSVRACRGRMEDTKQAARPSCGRSEHAGAGEKLTGSGDAPAAAVLRLPGRMEDTRQAARPGCGRSAHAGAGGRTLAGSTRRPWPLCTSRGGREDTWQAARPGCGWSAHAGAGEKLPGCGDAPAAVDPCLPGQDTGHQAGSTPRLWPICARRGGMEDTGRQHALAVAVLR